MREEGGGLLVGPFERDTKPWALDGVPEDFHASLLPPDLERLETVLEAAARRVPAFADAGIRSVVNGPDGYTPDGHCLMGPVPGVPDFHVLAGFSIFGIVFGGGAGKVRGGVDRRGTAERQHVGSGRAPLRRLRQLELLHRGSRVRGLRARVRDPLSRKRSCRPVGHSRRVPLYDRLLAKGAVYGARFAWERPLWFARSGPARDEYSYRRGNWHATVGEECRDVRKSVGVLDQTSFAKYEVSGPGAQRFLDRLCANKLPKTNGRMVLTQMCTPKGGIECDVTVTRLAEDRYYVVSAAATEQHDYAWIARHLPEDGSVRLENVTSAAAVLTLAGPRSRDLLQALTETDCSNAAFRFFRAVELHVGMIPVRALRLSFVGELGYELHHPVEYERSLYDLLMAAGERVRDRELRLSGPRIDAPREGVSSVGSDMSADWTPLQAGMERFVDFEKGDFIGRDALLRQRDEGVGRRLACLVVDTDDADPHAYEPVFADGEIIGYVASGGYGHTLEKSIAFSYLPEAYVVPGTEIEVEILGARRAAQVVEGPLYDPKNQRLLS